MERMIRGEKHSSRLLDLLVELRACLLNYVGAGGGVALCAVLRGEGISPSLVYCAYKCSVQRYQSGAIGEALRKAGPIVLSEDAFFV